MTTLLLYLLALFLPTQLGYHLWPSWAHVYGLRVDFLSPTIHFTDLLLLILLLFNLRPLLNLLAKYRLQAVILLLVITTNLLTSLIPLNTLITWLRYLLLFNFSFVIFKLDLPKLKNFFILLSLSTIFISLIAVAQFITSGSLDGFFYYLGERHFNLSTPDIAKTTYLSSTLYLRPYSTFSHPNSLAGYLLVMLLLLYSLIKKLKINQKLFFLSAALILLTLLLTFSRSAILALLIFLPLSLSANIKQHLPKLVLPLLFSITILSTLLPTTLIKDKSYSERIFLNKKALTTITSHPVTGIGLNNFIPKLVTLNPNQNFLLAQPAHNIYLLLLCELGLLSFITLLFTFKSFIKPQTLHHLPLLAILFTGLFDHYWLTLPQNQLLLFIVLGIAMNRKFQSS